MLSVYIWVRLIVGAGFMIMALVMWVQRRRHRSIAWRRWLSLMNIAIGLCAWFSAAEELTNPHAFGLWGVLQLAALLLAAWAWSSAVVSTVREKRREASIPS